MESTRQGGAAKKGDQISLYARWTKIQPLWVRGRFQTLRRIALSVLVALLYVGPWIRSGGRPAIWLDLPARHFLVFGTTYWPQDLVFLSWLLIISAFALFVFTVLLGRLWCGYACPQTVWTWVFVWIEKCVEGDRNRRILLDRGPWRAGKIGKKALKLSLWVLVSLSISITFVGYFIPIRELLPRLVSLDLGSWERFWLLFPAGVSFLMFGVLREQVCLHMCPYARFQSVMFDHDTLTVSYDSERGEPRGSRSRRVDPSEAGLGACVNCRLCVHACPTGIDIRDGLQYECIGCAACIDVCNGVMERMGYAPDLIRYSSERQDQHEQSRLLRPRLLGYAAVLFAMLFAFGWQVTHRVPLEVDVFRDRNRLYREHYDGTVENVYTLHILNMDERDRVYRVAARGEVPLRYSGQKEVHVAAGAQYAFAIRLLAQPDAHAGTTSDVEFEVIAVDDPNLRTIKTSRFLRPAPREDGRG